MRIRLPFALSLLLAAGAAAQAAPGLPSWGTFEGGRIDSINVGTLQVRFTFPMLRKKGVGLDVNLPLVLDNENWGMEPGASFYWYIPYGQVLDINTPVGEETWTNTQETCTDAGGDINDFYSVYSNYAYTDSAGVAHPMNLASGSIEDPFPTDCDPSQDPGFPTSSTGIAADGSGWTLDTASGYVTSPTGTKVMPAPFAPETMVDRDGNTESWSGSSITGGGGSTGTLTDTLGVAALAVSGSEPTFPYPPTVFSYPNPSGGQSSYTVGTSSFTLVSPPGCEYSGYSEAASLPTTIALPDGTAYAITYEQPPGYGAGYTTGRVATITLPTGGTISYGYPGADDDMNCSAGTSDAGELLELTRTTADGTTTYVHSGNQTTVTDPEGNVTVYTTFATTPEYYGLGDESFIKEKQVYQGSSTLLETEQFCYDGTVASCTGYPAENTVTGLDDEITLPDGLRRHTQTVLNSAAGAPSEVDESDWGTNGEGGTWLRHTITSFQDAAFPGLPTAIFVEDGSNNVTSNTEYTRNAHGDATAVTRSTTGTATLTQQFTFNANGTVNTETDANGGVTSYLYNACNGGLPTQVTEPVSGMTREMTWNCNGGVMTSETDENGGTTNWAFNDRQLLAAHDDHRSGRQRYPVDLWHRTRRLDRGERHAVQLRRLDHRYADHL